MTKNLIQKTMKNLIIPENGSMVIHSLDDILYFESESNYCRIYLRDKKRTVMLSKGLNKVESLVDPDCFCRINRQHLINLTKIIEYKNTGGNYVIMEGNIKLSVSRRRKKDFFEKMNKLYVWL